MTGTTRGRTGLLSAGLVLVFVLILPQLATAGQLFFWTTVVVAIVFATSTNLLFGQAGIPSFGQAGFFGAGAYTTALLAQSDLPVLLVLLAAILVGAAVAAVAAVIAWRSTGLVFSMLTLAFAQSLYTIAIKTEALGGYNGLAGLSIETVLGIDVTDPGYLWYFVVLAAAAICAFYWLVSASPLGRTLRAIRDDPVRVLFLGVNVRAYRAIAFVLAGAGAGAAGGLSAYVTQVVAPSALYWTASATPVIMLVLGGMAYFWGPAVGAVLLTALMHQLSQWTNAYIFYVGLLLYLVLIFLPGGMLSLPDEVRDRWRSRGRTGSAAGSTAVPAPVAPVSGAR